MKRNQKRLVDPQHVVVGKPDCNPVLGGISMTKYLDSVIYGNCVEVLSSLPAESVDFCVTSPPYDDLRSYHGYLV